jgi:hypothetical protein
MGARLASRSKAQIAEAVKIRTDLAKEEVKEALGVFGQIASRHFPWMPSVKVISDEECKAVWGTDASDQGDFSRPRKIRVSESSSRETAFHEAVHFLRHFSKLDRNGSLPYFTQRGLSEMCSMFVSKATCGHGVESDPLLQVLNLYEMKRSRQTDVLELICDHTFFMEVRGLMSVKNRTSASEFFLKTTEDAVFLAKLDSRSSKVSQYSFGKALAVLHLLNNDLSVQDTLKDMITLSEDNLLRKIVGQPLKPETRGFLEIIDSKLFSACRGDSKDKSRGPIPELRGSELTTSLLDMTGHMPLSYYQLLRDYHPARREIGNSFIYAAPSRLQAQRRR